MAFGNKEHRKENNSRLGLLSLFICNNAICEAVYARFRDAIRGESRIIW